MRSRSSWCISSRRRSPRSAIAERYTEQLDHIAAAIEVAQEHGAIRPDLDPRTVRIELEVARALHAERWLTDLVATARTPHELRAGLCRRAAVLASPERLPALWQRTESLAAARTDLIIRGELATIERAGRSRTDEAVGRAQQRGLIDPTLHPGSVSRMLHTSTMWHLPYDLDLRRPAPATWTATVSHMAVALLPEA